MWSQVRNSLRSRRNDRHPWFAVIVVFLLSMPVFVGCDSPKHSGSVGVLLGRHNHSGAVHVRDVPAGLAGDKAGLRNGDRIKMIDGQLVDRLEPQRIRELLRGPEGSSVTLTIIRGDEVLHVAVIREPLGKKSAGSAKPVE
jgi:C-terminal processing protease CtpA/Prc